MELAIVAIVVVGAALYFANRKSKGVGKAPGGTRTPPDETDK